MPSTRSPYSGTSRKLVLAFDIGTTYSGVSYSILDPGQAPEIKGVTRFPGQEKVGGDSKIPTIIYYSKDGKVRAVGAEAVQENIREQIEDEEWTKAEWFKLHMRPKGISGSHTINDLPPLPKNKTTVQLLADFMTYLYTCTKTYIQETHANGTSLWAAVEQNIEYVLTHPNGWEGAQQQQMRQAAVLAKLIPDTLEGHSRIRFVTEGEASLHFCIQNGLTTEALKSGGGVLIVDAGGGTIDISAYGQTPQSAKFEEITVPECHLQGSVFVTSRARLFLEKYLRGSKFADDIGTMTEAFDKSSKLAFEKSINPLFVRFGGARDRDPKLNIRAGQIKLEGKDVATFFEPSITCIKEAIMKQRKHARKPISCIFLVGGFSASEYLFSQLKESLEPMGIELCRPDSHLNKAVADGAISFYLDHSVSVRVSRVAYGTECNTPYRKDDVEHRSRSSRVFQGLDGVQRLPDYFSTILPKDVQVSETQEFRNSYTITGQERSVLEHVMSTIQCYRGTSRNPKWVDTEPDMYSTLCYVEADMSLVCKSLVPQQTRRGPYFRMEFDIILSFGLTELTAQISWREDNVEKRSPAKIVYDYDFDEQSSNWD